MKKKVLTPIDRFKPEAILISAGFDAHFRDPLANINLESHDFFDITKKEIDKFQDLNNWSNMGF